MAVTHVGTETYNNPVGTNAGASHNVSVPPGTQDGDYMVLTTYGSTAAITVPAAWTLLADNTSSTTLRYAIYHKIASSEPASYNITSTNNTRGTSISVFRGVESGTIDDGSILGTVIDTAGTDPLSAASTLDVVTTGTVVFTARASRNNSLTEVAHQASDTELADFGADNGTNARTCALYLSSEKAVANNIAGLSINDTSNTVTHSITYNLLMAPPVSAPAGQAPATAAAPTPTEAVKPSAGAAGATATARQPTVSTSSNATANAGRAATTATANNATVSTSGSANAPAGVAGATATARNPTVTTTGGAVSASAGVAAVSASAHSPDSTAPEGAILPTNADWNIWIDWDKDLGVNLTSFETGTAEGWAGEGNPEPLLEVDLEAPSQPVKHGRRSLRVDWQIDTSPVTTPFTFGLAGQGFDQGSFQVNNPPVEGPFVSPTVERVLTGLVAGRQYTASAWFYVPTGSPDVRLQCNGTNGAFTTGLDQWVQATVTFNATATEHTLVIDPEVDPSTTTQKLYVETVQLTHTTEPVQDRVLGLRQSLSFKYGRDTARSLEAMGPTDASFELDNRDLELSPDNPDSIYNPYLIPGRPIYVRADWDDRFYSMFYGFLDSYTLKPGREDDSVEFGATDMLSQLSDFQLDTEVYRGLQTGEAINVILDEMNWPEHRRQIDHGATTVSWWHESGTDALEAVKRLVDSEGLPAFAYVDRHGNFVFRDRHHRYLDDRSLNSQATFWSGVSDEEPQFCEPFEYDLGWTDLINQVDFEVEIRQPRPLEEVFSQDEETVIQLKAGEAYVLDVEGSDPFIDAVEPIPGTVVVTDTSSAGEPGDEEEEVISPANADFVIRTGTSNVTATLSRTSGSTTQITFLATGGDATISNVRLRARPIQVTQTIRVKAEDPESVANHGPRTYDGEAPWANIHDADAIARTIVGTRSERLPIVSFTVNSGNETRYLQVLERDLSDRIHLVENKTFTDHDFFIESIEHNIEEVGWDHRATFSCERVKDLEQQNTFEFGSATAGFDEGVFGGIGFIPPEDMFILGQSKLNTHKLTM